MKTDTKDGRRKICIVVGTLVTVLILSVGLGALAQASDTWELISADEAGIIEVTVRATPRLDQVSVWVRSYERTPIQVEILPGTVFSTGDAGYQRMGVIQRVVIHLDAWEEKTVIVPVACLDMELEQPYDGMVFRGGIAPAISDAVSLLITLPEFQELAFRSQQFTLWTALTHPATREEYYGLGLGGDAIDALVAFGISEDIIVSLYYFPEVFYEMPFPELMALEMLFAEVGVPVEGADELFLLFTTGRPTMQELAQIAQLLDLAGFALDGFMAAMI